MGKFYEPAEDSFLLLECALSYIENSVYSKDYKILEIGVGSGYVLSSIAKKYPEFNYFGTDINNDAIENTKLLFSEIECDYKLAEGNLFESFLESYDFILFNTPYLPCEDGENYDNLSILDKALYGGKNGWEVIEQFIFKLGDRLNNDGVCLMVFSSLSNYNYVKKILDDNFFIYELVKEEKVFFESIYCLKIQKSQLLKDLSSRSVSEISYLASGKHSKVLQGNYNGKNCIVKVGLEKDIQIEIEFLEKLSNYGFTPEFFFSGKDFVVREKVDGLLIEDFFNIASSSEIEFILNKIFEITYELDMIGINKQEMTHPYKHIYILEDMKTVKMIDYERCLYTLKPKNTTQFLQYLPRFIPNFSKNGINLDRDKILDMGKKYKDNPFLIKVNMLKE